MQIIQEINLAPGAETEKETSVLERKVTITSREDAVRILSLLGADIPSPGPKRRGKGGGRRDSQRWIPPESVTVEVYDGESWHTVEALDCGIPGVRVIDLPAFIGDGPAVMRLTTPDSGAVLVTGDVMWHDRKVGTAGLHFTFQNDEDREAWFEGLVEALLSQHAMN